jgi:hypothetical protein
MIDCIDGNCFTSGYDGSTELFAFALDGTGTTYVASGTVEGQIRDRWSMDYSGDTLRVALGATNETGNFNSVVTMQEKDATLTEVGRVDKLGVNEEIKSVRWFDTLAIVVTFRQTDPLYAIDLTDASEPRLMGELKIPGFSEYLHPLGEMRLIGVGQDASNTGMTRGAQAALFDVTDLTEPRQLDVVKYPRHSMAGAGMDPRQFTWLPDQRTALTVVSQGWRGRTGWVSVLSLDGGHVVQPHGRGGVRRRGRPGPARAARGRAGRAGHRRRRVVLRLRPGLSGPALAPGGLRFKHVPQHPSPEQLRAAGHA